MQFLMHFFFSLHTIVISYTSLPDSWYDSNFGLLLIFEPITEHCDWLKFWNFCHTDARVYAKNSGFYNFSSEGFQKLTNCTWQKTRQKIDKMHQFPVCAMQIYPSFFIGYEHNKTAFIFMCLSRYPEAKTNFSPTKALLIKPCGWPFFFKRNLGI